MDESQASRTGSWQPIFGGTPLGDRILGMSQALHDEIETAQRDPERAFEVGNGRQVHDSEEGFLYTFTAEVALPLVPETPLRVLVRGKPPADGLLVSLHDFDLLLLVKSDLGARVPHARVTTEPWFIYDALLEKLGAPPAEPGGPDAGPGEPPELALALLGLKNLPVREDWALAARGERLLAACRQASLKPNQSQRLALARCGGSAFHFVWGPPGTGKSASLAQIVRTLEAEGQRCLVLAHANAAVDVAMLKLHQAFEGSPELAGGQVLRIGPPQMPEVRACRDLLPETVLEREQGGLIARKRRLEEARTELTSALASSGGPGSNDASATELGQVRVGLAEVRASLREGMGRLIRQAGVLGATLSRFVIDNDLWNWRPDTVVVDEASMASLPMLLAAALRARTRLLLFGDFRQLPAICSAQSRIARKWLATDAFEVSGVKAAVDRGLPEPRLTLLEQQYRMAPAIAEVVSALAYQNRLVTAEGVAQAVAPLAGLPPFAGHPVVLIDTTDLQSCCFREPRAGSFSRVNTLHAALAMGLLRKAAAAGCKDAALIAPYRAQARVLAAACKGLRGQFLAATVHRFQGSERDLILADLVDALPENCASRLTGSEEDLARRLLNVTLSRVRGKLVVLADAAFIRERHPPTSPARQMLARLERSGVLYRPAAGELRALCADDRLDFFADWAEACSRLAEDVASCQGTVTVNFAPGFVPTAELVTRLAERDRQEGKTTLFAPAPVARLFETGPRDVRLMTRPGGFFALAGSHAIYVGGRAGSGPVARLDDTTVARTLSKLLLGESTAVPVPTVEVEAEVRGRCGNCAECGQPRWPRRCPDGGWAIRCRHTSHPGVPLGAAEAAELARLLGARCLACDAPLACLARGRALQLVCSRGSAAGCRDRAPRLEDLFGGA